MALVTTLAAQTLPLRDWQLQSSTKLTAGGAALSRPGFATQGWYPVKLPATVLAGLLQNKLYPDPYYGLNLRSLPGANYKRGFIFANLPMPEDSPFRASWWYRAEFRVTKRALQQHHWLRCDGINYRANIWLNGQLIADKTQVAGAFRLFEFDVTEALKTGVNALAIEVFPPQPDDLGITWVDWNPAPPDKNMGLWRGVSLVASGPVTVRHPQVVSKINKVHERLGGDADLTIYAELRNAGASPVTGVLRGKLGRYEDEAVVQQQVTLQPGEIREVAFTPGKFPQLQLKNASLWWPVELGQPTLYQLQLDFTAEGQVSDHAATKFGIRETTSTINEHGTRVFAVNGQRLFIRGAGYTPDMLLRHNPQREEDELNYVLDMGLNTIRLEGKLGEESLLDLADRKGLLVMAGWCCCDHWEKWDNWKPEDYTVAAVCQRDQLRRLRNHASVFVWLNGSDGPPPPAVEKSYLEVIKAVRWPNPVLSSATAKKSSLTGATGVKMTGPYDWVPPAYWYLDKKTGGAHGFNTETGPGPAIPVTESLRKFVPPEQLWPLGDAALYHAGGGQFRTLDIFNQAMNARYGPPKSLDDYTLKAQVMAYEGQRAMFEAYLSQKYQAGGVIQWMLNNAWPSLIWHLYDYYLQPGGGYFGTKKARGPFHVSYSYADRSIVAVTAPGHGGAEWLVRVRVLNADMSEKFSAERRVRLAPDSVETLWKLPAIAGLSPVWFVHLEWLQPQLHNPETSRGDNFYWLSTTADVLDNNGATWYHTPVATHANFKTLADLSPVKLKLSGSFERGRGEDTGWVALENDSPHLAFFVRLQITAGPGGDEILPVLWSDNYVSLRPGERGVVTVKYRSPAAQTALTLKISGWNVAPQTIPWRRNAPDKTGN